MSLTGEMGLMAFATSVDQDQHGNPRSLIRVCTISKLVSKVSIMILANGKNPYEVCIPIALLFKMDCGSGYTLSGSTLFAY